MDVRFEDESVELYWYHELLIADEGVSHAVKRPTMVARVRALP